MIQNQQAQETKVLETKMNGKSTIPVRKMGFDFSNVPKYYMNGNIEKSHLFNALNLLFPEGERFFMRAVRDGLNQIDNPDLKQQARGFFGQETQHAIEHEKFFEILEQQGYQFRPQLTKVIGFIQKMRDLLPLSMRLSITAGAEHLTAVLGATALNDVEIDNAHPAMRDLIQWHAIEEVEHKSIAYDVYQENGGGYLTRMMGYVGVMIFIQISTSYLSKVFYLQDGYSKAEAKKMFKQSQKAMKKQHKNLAKDLRAYFKKDFHPNDIDESHLVTKAMARMGIA